VKYKYAKKSFRFAKNKFIGLIDNRSNGKKSGMLKCKNPIYADWVKRGEKKNGTISIRSHGQEGKGNITVTIERIAAIGGRNQN
jgi:threonyl-tRNA synthetase